MDDNPPLGLVFLHSLPLPHDLSGDDRAPLITVWGLKPEASSQRGLELTQVIAGQLWSRDESVAMAELRGLK